MRIAFVEVRDKTRLFEAVAAKIGVRHSVSWLVQNHRYYSATMSNPTLLPYPGARDIESARVSDAAGQDHLSTVRDCDRFHVTFGATTAHYAWYYGKIKEWFDRERPEIVIGEVGNFHSHMVSLLAEDAGALFVNPTSSRYPPGRFSFFVGDRLRPFGGDSVGIDDDALDSAVHAIATGARMPDYMTVRTARWEAARYRIDTLAEWFRGERFATQAPWYFAGEKRTRSHTLSRWDRLAEKGKMATLDRSAPSVLYPLQMQPELNLDVWAREYRDQANLVAAIAKSGATVLVKPNPKSFHELSPSLVDVAAAAENIIALGRDAVMTEVEPSVEMVVTASGTIAIERLIRKRPVAILLQDYADLLGVQSLHELGLELESLGTRASCDAIAAAQARVNPREVLSRLVETSYPGMISEPRLMPSVMSETNIVAIVRALEDVVDRVGVGEVDR